MNSYQYKSDIQELLQCYLTEKKMTGFKFEKQGRELDKRKLASRLAYIVSKQRKAMLIKTIEVLDQGFNRNSLNRIKKESARNFGRDYKEVMKETRERYFSNNHKQNIVKEFEEIN